MEGEGQRTSGLVAGAEGGDAARAADAAPDQHGHEAQASNVAGEAQDSSERDSVSPRTEEGCGAEFSKACAEHEALTARLNAVALEVANLSLMRKNLHLSSLSAGHESGEKLPTEVVVVAFPAPYVRNPRPLLEVRIELARPWCEPAELVKDRNERLAGIVENIMATRRGVATGRRKELTSGLRLITEDACLCIYANGVGPARCIPHSCFHKHPRTRLSEGGGSTMFLEGLWMREPQRGVVQNLANSSEGASRGSALAAKSCVEQNAKLPVDRLLNVSNACRAIQHALFGSLKGGKSRGGAGRQRANLPPPFSVARAWRPDDSSGRRVHNLRPADESNTLCSKRLSGTKLDVCIHAQLLPDMAYMVVEGAHGCLLKHNFNVPTIDGSPTSPLLPISAASVFACGPDMVRKDGVMSVPIQGEGYIFFNATATGALHTSEVWVFALHLGFVCPAIATQEYCRKGLSVLDTGDGRPHMYHRRLFGCSFAGSPRHQQDVLDNAPPENARGMRRGTLCDSYLLPFAALDDASYSRYRWELHTAARSFEGLKRPGRPRGTLSELLDHYPEAVGKALPRLREVFSGVLGGSLGADSLCRLQAWDKTVNEDETLSGFSRCGSHSQRWQDVPKVLRVALGIDNLATMLVTEGAGSPAFDISSVPVFMKEVLTEIYKELQVRLQSNKLQASVSVRDVLCFLVQPLATFALEWTRKGAIPQALSVMYDFFEVAQDVRNGKVLHEDVIQAWATALGVVDLDAVFPCAPLEDEEIAALVLEGDVHEEVGDAADGGSGAEGRGRSPPRSPAVGGKSAATPEGMEIATSSSDAATLVSPKPPAHTRGARVFCPDVQSTVSLNHQETIFELKIGRMVGELHDLPQWEPQTAMAHRLGFSRVQGENVQAHVACEFALKWAVLHGDWATLIARLDAHQFGDRDRAEDAMLEREFRRDEEYAQMVASSLWCELEAEIALACVDAAARLDGTVGGASRTDDEEAVVHFQIISLNNETVEFRCHPCAQAMVGAGGDPREGIPEDLFLHQVTLRIVHEPGFEKAHDIPFAHSISVGKLVRIRWLKRTEDEEQVLLGLVESRDFVRDQRNAHGRSYMPGDPGYVRVTLSVSGRVKEVLNTFEPPRRQGRWCKGSWDFAVGSLTPVHLLRPAFAVLRVLKCVEDGRYKTASQSTGQSGRQGGCVDRSTTDMTNRGYSRALKDKASLMAKPEIISLIYSRPSRRNDRHPKPPPSPTDDERLRAEMARDFCDLCMREDSADSVDDPQQRVLRELMHCNIRPSDFEGSGKTWPAIVFVQGPPGSGKSRMAHRVINLHLLANHALASEKNVQDMRLHFRVLVTAERNSAVDDCLRAILKGEPLFDSDGKPMARPRCLRLGRKKFVTSADVQAVNIEVLLDTPRSEWPDEWRGEDRPRGNDPGDPDTHAFALLYDLEARNSRERQLNEDAASIDEFGRIHDGWRDHVDRGRSRDQGMMGSGRASRHHRPERKLTGTERRAREALRAHLLAMAHVVGVTVGSMKLGVLDDGPYFDHVVFEESSTSNEASWAYILFRLFDGHAPRSYLVVGDDAQGRPFAVSQNPKARARLTFSPFSRLKRAMGSDVILFTRQYRMSRKIWELINTLFYEGKVETGLPESEFKCDFATDYFERFGPVTVWDTSKDAPGCSFGEGQTESTGSLGRASRFNRGEAQVVMACLRCLVSRYPGSKRVLVLSHYQAQVDLLKGLLAAEKVVKTSEWEVIIQTVDSAQGKQADLTIYSLTRSHSEHGSGAPQGPPCDLTFINDEHAVNVATTRSRYGLVVIGNVSFIEEKSGKNSCWARFFEHYRSNGIMRSARVFEKLYVTRELLEKDPLDVTPAGSFNMPDLQRLVL